MPYWAAFAAAVVLSFVGAVIIEQALFKPVARAPVNQVVMLIDQGLSGAAYWVILILVVLVMPSGAAGLVRLLLRQSASMLPYPES